MIMAHGRGPFYHVAIPEACTRAQWQIFINQNGASLSEHQMVHVAMCCT